MHGCNLSSMQKAWLLKLREHVLNHPTGKTTTGQKSQQYSAFVLFRRWNECIYFNSEKQYRTYIEDSSSFGIRLSTNGKEQAMEAIQRQSTHKAIKESSTDQFTGMVSINTLCFES